MLRQAVAIAVRDPSQQSRARSSAHGLSSMPKFSTDIRSAVNGMDDSAASETPTPTSSRTASSLENHPFTRESLTPQQSDISIEKATREESSTLR